MDANIRAVATYNSTSTASALKEVTDCWRNKNIYTNNVYYLIISAAAEEIMSAMD